MTSILFHIKLLHGIYMDPLPLWLMQSDVIFDLPPNHEDILLYVTGH